MLSAQGGSLTGSCLQHLLPKVWKGLPKVVHVCIIRCLIFENIYVMRYIYIFCIYIYVIYIVYNFVCEHLCLATCSRFRGRQPGCQRYRPHLPLATWNAERPPKRGGAARLDGLGMKPEA